MIRAHDTAQVTQRCVTSDHVWQPVSSLGNPVNALSLCRYCKIRADAADVIYSQWKKAGGLA